ncbi:cupredoxin domain-containing protein [Candidatus Nitrosocosmicus hydrocola]|uniref:cupredoxin domain-containing protein n=1 Tax=Candidatus Nitrosocosmicus hydrocola TaxID=1826872 RepID=UPI0011E59298|nr:plastocyanin/azurin family copper-binding protein [Candidatus Nitrosocosmicus hydrocola]
MTDWDLLMPGAGLTTVGAVGVTVALSGIAKTFMDGMHAVSILCMFFGLIFLTAGLFKDGFPTSKKAKTAAGIILILFITAGIIGAVQIGTKVPSIYQFMAIVLTISIPSIIIIIASYRKMAHFVKISAACVIVMIVGSGILISTIWMGVPVTATTEGENNATSTEETTIPKVVNTTIVPATIPAGASGQGNPSYEPAVIEAKKGEAIEWTNLDNVPHTVTSFADDGKSFDSSLIMMNEKYVLDTSTLTESEYEYFCTLHPFMKANFQLG